MPILPEEKKKGREEELKEATVGVMVGPGGSRERLGWTKESGWDAVHPFKYHGILCDQLIL